MQSLDDLFLLNLLSALHTSQFAQRRLRQQRTRDCSPALFLACFYTFDFLRGRKKGWFGDSSFFSEIFFWYAADNGISAGRFMTIKIPHFSEAECATGVSASPYEHDQLFLVFFLITTE